MVVWIIGKSGSGKTFLSKKLFSKIKNKKKILIDGDDVRKYINYNLKYSKKDRKKNSIFISNLCNFLEKKGYLVICSILSIFPEHQKRNRKIYNNYLQIFMDVDQEILKKHNIKKLYGKNIKNVVGEKLKFPTPYKNDFVIKNDFKPIQKKTIQEIIKKIK